MPGHRSQAQTLTQPPQREERRRSAQGCGAGGKGLRHQEPVSCTAGRNAGTASLTASTVPPKGSLGKTPALPRHPRHPTKASTGHLGYQTPVVIALPGAQDRRAVTDATRTEGRGGPREPGLGHPEPLCGSISAPAPCGARRQSVQVFVPCFMEREVSFWRWGKNASIDSSLQAGHSV